MIEFLSRRLSTQENPAVFAEMLYYSLLDDCMLKMSVFPCLEFRDSTSSFMELLEKDINQKRSHIYFRVVPHVGTWIEIQKRILVVSFKVSSLT